MKKLSAQTKEQILEAIRNPVGWWKGRELPEDSLRPWEGGIQFLAEALKGFMEGFTNIKDRLYLGLGAGKIPPNWKSVHDVTKITWDAVNDPIIGSYMDRRRFGERAHRWMMRFNATFSPFFILIQCFSFGLTPMQRIIMWTAITMFADLMSTANTVSETKIWAGITPYSNQRGTLQLCQSLGKEVSGFFGGIPMMLMGLKDVIGLTDYQIMIYGAMIFAPLTIFCRWLPSFAKQRVDFTLMVKGEGEEGEEPEPVHVPTLRESFTVVKHNRWFIMTSIVSILQLLLPRVDYLLLYRFLVPTMRFRGKEIGGEVFNGVKGFLIGFPSLLLQPMAATVAEKLGGNVNFFRVKTAVKIIVNIIKFFVGYQTWPRLIIMSLLEMVDDTFNRWAPIPETMIKFEMFDYVEWKTGQRSEGMTMAVDGMIKKLIKDNLYSVFGNAVLQWTGYQGWDVPREQQPESFLKAVWPLIHTWGIFGEAFFLIGLMCFRSPHDPKEVEADLIERRALAQQMKEETQVS